jgi:hypothetical protein
MLPAPRIIIIDDNELDLRGLADALNRFGAACLPILFTGDVSELKSCPRVRVIFADLHLNESGAGNGDHARHFAMIGGLIEESLAPTGPYIIVLWTRFAGQANALREFLDGRLVGVRKPFAVASLDKTKHLDSAGKVRNVSKLVAAIEKIVSERAQIAALFNWEERVLDAAAETVSAVIDLTTAVADPKTRDRELGRLLCRLAVEAVGEAHVERDRFQAVNGTLLPILADRIAFLEGRPADERVWRGAFGPEDIRRELKAEEAARLNRLLQIAEGEGTSSSDRGAVIGLPPSHAAKFENRFGTKAKELASEQFACKDYADTDGRFRWILVQIQAACDFAQQQPGPLPYLLGLEMPFESKSKGTAPGALWISPPVAIGGKTRLLVVNSRFQVSLSRGEAKKSPVLFRVREALLNDLAYRFHSYGARPGIISFHEKKALQTPPNETGEKKPK